MRRSDRRGDGANWVWRGLAAFGTAAGMAVVAGFAGYTFGRLEQLPEGLERSFYTYGTMAAMIVVILLVWLAGSRSFQHGRAGAPGTETTTGERADDTGRDATASGAERNSGWVAFASPVVLFAIFYNYIEVTDRASGLSMELLPFVRQPLALTFAIAVTPIMGILAVAERPEGAWVKWRTIVFTAAFWPLALWADVVAPTAVQYEGFARLFLGGAAIVVAVAWIALGGALGTLDVMFSNPRAYERLVKGIGSLEKGWNIWHGVPFIALLFASPWLDSWTGISAIAGNPTYFAALFAAATLALSRPRDARGWTLAVLAGVAVATVLLGGAATADWIVAMAAMKSPAAHLAFYLLLALPAFALMFGAIFVLGSERAEAHSPDRDSR